MATDGDDGPTPEDPFLAKAPSGIRGFDEITHGGLPRGRPTVIAGGPGTGKTLFATEFLVRGALDHGEPGVFMAFEETAEDLAANVASLGFDLKKLQDDGHLFIDYVRVQRSEIEATGEFDLEGLFVRLQHAVDTVGAKRVALDTMESLFSSLPNVAIVRAELRRLFGWLRDHGLTAVMTAEEKHDDPDRYSLEQYVSDCVIYLSQRVDNEIASRRLRVVKYRGSTHQTNEFPFLLDEKGVSVLPITSLDLDHAVSDERISTGVDRLDAMLGVDGYLRGSTVLVSGTAGTGKSTLSASLAESAARSGEKVLYLATEESTDQVVRNMGTVGIDLRAQQDSGRLHMLSRRPHALGLESHLLSIQDAVDNVEATVLIVDPITNFEVQGSHRATRLMLVRMVDYMKTRGVTTLMTSLTRGGADPEASSAQISSLIDTWLVLRTVRANGERNRTLSIVKSRGMSHSNQAAEYTITSSGIELVDTYLGPEGVLTGSARSAQEELDRSRDAQRELELARRRELLERRRRIFEARQTVLREEFEAEEAELAAALEKARTEEEASAGLRRHLAGVRATFEEESAARGDTK